MRQMTLTSALLVFWILAVVWGQGVRVTRPQIKLTAEQEIRACQKCHGNPDIYGFDVRGRKRSVYVDEKAFRNSVHGKLRCTDCHNDIDPTQLPHPRHTQKVECGRCHLERELPQAPGFKVTIFKSYADSVHGEAVARGDPDAPRCADCHGHHNILPAKDPNSQVNRRNIPQTCSRCHSDAQLVEWHQIPKGETLFYYERSVHGQLLRKGVVKGSKSAPNKPPAVCTDCHGIHGIRPATDPHSKVARPQLPETCGQCHEQIYKEWRRSIHGQAWAKGIKEAPVCTDCHGEHVIRSPQDPTSLVHPQHIVATCSKCHENEVLQRRLGLPTLRLATYRTSYHGIMNRYGVTEVAHCASCHGAHDILPSTDPRSPIHPNNLPKTCGSCHPGIGEKVAFGKVHFAGTRAESPIYWLIKVLYQLLIAGLIGYFSVYIVLDIRNYLKGRPSHAVSPHRPDDPLSHEYVERFTLNERLQHLVLVISFTLLVISGLPLSYAEAGWAKWFYTFPGSAQLRGIIHRIGAVMLMALAVWHVIYLLTPRGREQLKHLRWTRKDFADIWQMLKCYLGLSDEKPKFGRFNWIEKLEYYAVVWGTTVMVLTGLALWFEAQALTILPLWVWHICRLIHSYEALLAFLTIIIWHLYHVHFKPGVFPMSWVWLTGKISLRHLQEEHPLEFEQLQQQVEQTAQQKP
ncbi:MAG: hypothetical protein OGMRLDGQ_002205 [Candidatus Fervidibacter sp.]